MTCGSGMTVAINILMVGCSLVAVGLATGITFSIMKRMFK